MCIRDKDHLFLMISMGWYRNIIYNTKMIRGIEDILGNGVTFRSITEMEREISTWYYSEETL